MTGVLLTNVGQLGLGAESLVILKFWVRHPENNPTEG